ncbi:hypothetical protein IM792_15515 [Mucilaginibacter sp. JRF]|uniref:hypothetical protein n=1 Tax=Mucilaginibacter sp. JRF TaxID=2780088 RepID=UPI001880E97A|nr:hypothetical protein [Mucilaginibacter sp. JRF]MBE9585864.1 hypothetical protein [Mucilaginibacter sp. JRF]
MAVFSKHRTFKPIFYKPDLWLFKVPKNGLILLKKHLPQKLYKLARPDTHFIKWGIIVINMAYFYEKFNDMKRIKLTSKNARLSSSIGNGKVWMMKSVTFLVLIALMFVGCKKDKSDEDSRDTDYGYAKLTVTVEKKAHVAYGGGDKYAEFDINQGTATYYIRYKRNYPLDLQVTPLESDQRVNINVYSREEKQIFNLNEIKQAGVLWTAKVTIP